MSDHLTPSERETVIVLSDADGVAHISTHQRRILTKLRRNPAAHEVEDLTVGKTAGASFELPADLISFRSKRRAGGAGNVASLAAHRQRRASDLSAVPRRCVHASGDPMPDPTNPIGPRDGGADAA